MPNILTLNKIAACGLEQFPADYVCGDAVESPIAVLVRSASMHETPLDPATIAIARAGAGVNNIPVDACTQAGVAVFNTPGANANAVKELVIAALFLASRKIADALTWCKTLKGEGENVGKLVEKGKSAFGGPEIFGKTLGVVGLGAIGRLVANAAAALGMKVVGVDPFLSDAARAQLDASVQILASNDELYAVSDYITLHAPLTPETKHMIASETLAKCKKGVRLLNFSRADLVDSTALLDALKCGQIAAYVTDFPTDDLIGIDGVTAIPHLGASTPESEDNCAIMAAQQLTAYIERGEIKNAVNLPAAALPVRFVKRLTVIHDTAKVSADAIYAAISQTSAFSATFTRKDVSYTVADYTEIPDIVPLLKLDGVFAVRVLP
ncbi:MAG: 3-phosphoglycerate dehydrogenase [Oscillospiraceae bacterium]|jgi:D-3-phosphoglycerate dehydrogenase|nr:3-phosphoglycerate dehydrogenase [Oscillospiraceae bacterium]